MRRAQAGFWGTAALRLVVGRVLFTLLVVVISARLLKDDSAGVRLSAAAG